MSEDRAWQVVARVGAVGFGAFIAVTSAAGIFLGVQAGNGWLAILYGLLGCAMGIAGIVATFVDRPLRSALLGCFLIGIAARAVLDGGLYIWLFSFPIAAILVAALALELSKRASQANTMAALGGAALALFTLVLLAIAAPRLPVICPSPVPLGHSPEARFSYPPSTFPWDATEYMYIVSCP